MKNSTIIVFIILIILIIYFYCQNVAGNTITGNNMSERLDAPPPVQKVIVFNGFWTLDDVRKHPDWLFVYGDNDLHTGKGGQAIIRDEPNAMGIPTKKKPDDDNGSFYSDSELDSNRKKISQAVSSIRDAMDGSIYSALVFPKDGLGTGRAQLNTKAPNTFGYLQYQIKTLAEDVEAGSSDRLKL